MEFELRPSGHGARALDCFPDFLRTKTGSPPGTRDEVWARGQEGSPRPRSATSLPTGPGTACLWPHFLPRPRPAVFVPASLNFSSLLKASHPTARPAQMPLPSSTPPPTPGADRAHHLGAACPGTMPPRETGIPGQRAVWLLAPRLSPTPGEGLAVHRSPSSQLGAETLLGEAPKNQGATAAPLGAPDPGPYPVPRCPTSGFGRTHSGAHARRPYGPSEFRLLPRIWLLESSESNSLREKVQWAPSSSV